MSLPYPDGIFWELTKKKHLDYRAAQLEKEFAKIQEGINELKNEQDQKKFYDLLPNETKEVAKVKDICNQMKFSRGKFWYVPSDYYYRPLVERKRLLQAPSISHLCKTMIIENVTFDKTKKTTRFNSPYYAVVIQYVTKLNTDKISFHLSKKNSSTKKYFSFRLAKNSHEVTGYDHNATPPLLPNVKDLYFILSEKVMGLRPQILFMGGGHVDVKLELEMKEYVKKIDPIIIDCTDDLTQAEIDSLDEHEKQKKCVDKFEEPKIKKKSPEKVVKEDVVVKKNEKKKEDTKKEDDEDSVEKIKLNPNPHIFDIRIGEIKIVKDHPKGDRLYVEYIDVGDEASLAEALQMDNGGRQICSGIRSAFSKKEVLNKKVLVMCNLRPAKLMGVMSYGMILLGMEKESKDLCFPEIPDGVEIGERVFYKRVEKADVANRVNKKKCKKMLPLFCSDAKGIVCYDKYKMYCSKGLIKAKFANCLIT